MKRLAAFLFAALLSFPALAQTNFHAFWRIIDFSNDAQGLQRFKIAPIWVYTTSGTNVVSGDFRTRTLSADGTVTISNMVPGSYVIEIAGRTVTTRFTNNFPEGTEGLVNASDPAYLTAGLVSSDATTAYSKSQSDGLYASKSLNNSISGSNYFSGPLVASQTIIGNTETSDDSAAVQGHDHSNLLEEMTNAATSVVADLPAIYATETATGMVLLLDLPAVIPTALIVTGDPFTNVLTVSASKGNNSTALKGTPSLPWLTIGSAMSSSSPGDEIRVLAGSYPEIVEILSNRNVRLEKDVFVGTLGTTNRTGDATNWNWTLSGRGTITNLYLWSRLPIVAACWKVDAVLSFAYEGPHSVTAEDTVAAIALGNTGSETPGRYKVTARSVISAAHVANTMSGARLEVVTTRQTNGFVVNTSVADKSVNCVLVSDYISGEIRPQNSTTQPTTNRLTIGPRSGRLTWTNGQVVVFSASKAGTQPWVTVQNTDWFVPSGSNAAHTLTVGSGQMHLRLRDVYLNTPQITNGAAYFEVEPSSVYVTNANLEGWAQ